MSLKEIIIHKATSGRYFLTVACGLGFLYAVWKRILPPEAIASIVTMVFVSYFQKKTENGGAK